MADMLLLPLERQRIDPDVSSRTIDQGPKDPVRSWMRGERLAWSREEPPRHVDERLIVGSERRRGARRHISIVRERGMHFIPCVKDSLMELRRGTQPTPIEVSFCEAECVKFVLENKRANKVVLRMGWGFGKAACILETQTQRMVHLDAGMKAP